MTAHAKSISRVVFHADDFGMNAAVNRGILVSFRRGLLTSTSLLANAPHAEEACREWRTLVVEQASERLESQVARREFDEPQLPFDLGIHLNLSQGKPLTGDRYPAEMLDANGNFPGIGTAFYRMNRIRAATLRFVEEELNAQIEWMCDRGFRPHHLNGHQYVELIPQVAVRIPDLLRRYAIPVVRVARESELARNVLLKGRVATWGIGLVKRYYATKLRHRVQESEFGHPDRFFGTCHAGQVTIRTLSRFLNQATRTGCTEIGLHPGDDPLGNEISESDAWFDPLHGLRKTEEEWLCGPELRSLLAKRNLKLGRLQALGH